VSNPNLWSVEPTVVGSKVTTLAARGRSSSGDRLEILDHANDQPTSTGWAGPSTLGVSALHREDCVDMEPLGNAWADLRGTLLIVGATLLAAVLAVGVSLAMRATGPAGDVVAKTTNFRVSMPTTLRTGRHTFAYTNEGSVPHELLLFRTGLGGNALPLRSDGNVDEESPLLQKVADSGNATLPGGYEAVPTKEALAPGLRRGVQPADALPPGDVAQRHRCPIGAMFRPRCVGAHGHRPRRG
jgi:hypothetical protein